MLNQTEKLKTVAFGGFEKKSVIEYIQNLAQEKNEYKKRCEQLEAQAAENTSKLNAQWQIYALQLEQAKTDTEKIKEEIESAKRLAEEQKISADVKAEKLFNEFKANFKAGSAEAEASLNAVNRAVESLQNALMVLKKDLDNLSNLSDDGVDSDESPIDEDLSEELEIEGE